MFDTVHALSHPACLACQRAKVHRYTKTPLEPFLIPEQRFDHVHVDLVGPLPPSHAFTYVLIMMDMTTRWPEVALQSSITSAEVAQAFISTWVAGFGTLADFPLYRGVSQFYW